jgi:hypothetical protein|uniref:Uncharacterized protein n=1 Tax=Zea mays TaxID=4577 RepID=A0A804PFU6_MAIZE
MAIGPSFEVAPLLILTTPQSPPVAAAPSPLLATAYCCLLCLRSVAPSWARPSPVAVSCHRPAPLHTGALSRSSPRQPCPVLLHQASLGCSSWCASGPLLAVKLYLLQFASLSTCPNLRPRPSMELAPDSSSP